MWAQFGHKNQLINKCEPNLAITSADYQNNVSKIWQKSAKNVGSNWHNTADYQNKCEFNLVNKSADYQNKCELNMVNKSAD